MHSGSATIMEMAVTQMVPMMKGKKPKQALHRLPNAGTDEFAPGKFMQNRDRMQV